MMTTTTTTNTMTTNIEDAFKQTLLKNHLNSIGFLKGLKLSNENDTTTLKKLINLAQNIKLKGTPILIAKATTFILAKFATEKYPDLGKYIKANNIKIEITDDERIALLTKEDEDANIHKKTNITFLVCRNILSDLLNDQFVELSDAFKNKVSEHLSTTNDNNQNENSPTVVELNNNNNDNINTNITPPKPTYNFNVLGNFSKRKLDNNDEIIQAKLPRIIEEEAEEEVVPVIETENDTDDRERIIIEEKIDDTQLQNVNQSIEDESESDCDNDVETIIQSVSSKKLNLNNLMTNITENFFELDNEYDDDDDGNGEVVKIKNDEKEISMDEEEDIDDDL